MPPKNRFLKKDIIDAAFEIARQEGVEGVTAQKIAGKLKSSVAPIYVNFKDIDELKKEVINVIFRINDEMSEKVYTGKRFLDLGIASLKFAEEYSVLFHEFISNKSCYYNSSDKNKTDKEVIDEMKKDPELEDFNDQQLMSILIKMRIFTVGLSTMYVNGLLEGFTEEDCIKLLENTGNDIVFSMRNLKQG